MATNYSQQVTSAEVPLSPDFLDSELVPDSNPLNSPRPSVEYHRNVAKDRHSIASSPESLQSLTPAEVIPKLGLSQLPNSWTESTDVLLESGSLCGLGCSTSSLAITATRHDCTTPDVQEDSRHKSLALPVELGERHRDSPDGRPTTAMADETTNCQEYVDSSNSDVYPRLEVSELDIEMDNIMTTQCVGMRSRDELVVPPPPEEPEAESSNSSLRDRIGFTTERFGDDNVSVLDYKPIPLRWPFQVLLIAVIAGLF
ncbi:hypothetical protein V8F06_014280, partial [Rhypophila decipiens]